MRMREGRGVRVMSLNLNGQCCELSFSCMMTHHPSVSFCPSLQLICSFAWCDCNMVVKCNFVPADVLTIFMQQRYLNTARSLCKVQVPRFALRNWAPLTSSRFLSTEAAVEEDDEDVVGYVEYDMFDETYMTEKEKAYVRKIERGVGDLKKFAAETPVTPEEVVSFRLKFPFLWYLPLIRPIAS